MRLPLWLSMAWLRLRGRCRSLAQLVRRRGACDTSVCASVLPHLSTAVSSPLHHHPLPRRKPPRSWSASRAVLPWAWEQVVARPWLAALLGALAALLLWLLPLHAHIARVAWGSQPHALVPAQNSFAFFNLYGRAVRERRAATESLQLHARASDVVDWETLRLSVVGQLTHASRRSISVAYAKHGRHEWLGPTNAQHEALRQYATALEAQQDAAQAKEAARSQQAKLDAISKAKAALEAALAAARRQEDFAGDDVESEQDSSALAIASEQSAAEAAASTGAGLDGDAAGAGLPPPPQHVRPLRPPRSSHRWSFLNDGGVHLTAGPEGELVHATSAATTGAALSVMEVVRDYDASPSPLPVFLSLPSSVGDGTTGGDNRGSGSSAPRTYPLASPSQRALSLSQERVLCFYVFSNTDGEYMRNLHNFVRRVVRAPPAATAQGRAPLIDYIFLINQLPDAERRVDLDALPRLPPNARYIQHRNECYDWGSIGWILDIQHELESQAGALGGGTDPRSSSYYLHLHRYAYFIIMNSSVRGPWLPSYVDLSDPRNVWYAPLLQTLRRSGGGAKMVGPVVSCQIQPHLQSFILLTDAQGLSILRSQRSKEERTRWALETGEEGGRRGRGAAARRFDPSSIVRVNDADNLAAVRAAARANSRFVGQQGSCDATVGLADTPPGAAPDDLAGSGVFGCHSALEQAIVEAELGASALMLQAGYNIASLTLMHASVDFRRPSYQRCFEMRDNPSDVPLQGHLVPRGPHSPAALAEQARRTSEQQGEQARAQQEREFKEMLDHASHLARTKSDHSAVAAAIAGLLMAIPQRQEQQGRSHVVEGGSASELRSSLRATDLAATSDASKRAQSLVSPAPLLPTRPSAAFLSSRQAAVDVEPLWLDPLEVLFGKYKTHKKFPPKHGEAYQRYAVAAQQRRLDDYVREHVWRRRQEWEEDFAAHRLRKAVREREAATAARALALPPIPLQWGRAPASLLASRSAPQPSHFYVGPPRVAPVAAAADAAPADADAGDIDGAVARAPGVPLSPEEQEAEAEQIWRSEMARTSMMRGAPLPMPTAPLATRQRQQQWQQRLAGRGGPGAGAAGAGVAAVEGALSPANRARAAAAAAEAASDELVRVSLLRHRAERAMRAKAEAAAAAAAAGGAGGGGARAPEKSG